MKIGDFLKAELSSRYPWNCSTLPADWCISLGHPDFAADWRHITDEVECQRIIATAGGLITLWEQAIDDGLPYAEGDPQAGDIAIVGLRELEAGAVFGGERWALRLPHGLVFASPTQVEIRRAWRP